MAIRMSEDDYKKLQAKPAKGRLLKLAPALPIHITKYRNRKTGGYSSAKEAKRATELKLMEKAGTIRELKEQVPFTLLPVQRDENGKLVEREVKYVADFVYLRGDGVTVVEDVKGFRTVDYKLKRKMMLFFHNIRIVEV